MANKERAHEFSMGFVAASEKHKEQFKEKWEEVLSNAMVEPFRQWASPQRGSSPYRSSPQPSPSVSISVRKYRDSRNTEFTA